MLVTSLPFGAFDPADPCRIPGLLAVNLMTEAVDIAAPVDLVWRVITDFAHYPQWNPLNRFFQLDAHAAPGQMVTFGPCWGPYDEEKLGEAAFTQHEVITVWQENGCLAYAVVSRWLNAERVQHIVATGPGRTRYRTYERMSGILAPLVRLVYGRRIAAGFRANARALKKRAEALFAGIAAA